MFLLYTIWKRQKTCNFPNIFRTYERRGWAEMGEFSHNFHNPHNLLLIVCNFFLDILNEIFKSYHIENLLVDSNYFRYIKLMFNYTEQFTHFVLSKNVTLKDVYYSSDKVVLRIPKLLVIAYEKMFIARNSYYYKVFTV